MHYNPYIALQIEEGNDLSREVLPNIFLVEIPLPNNPLKALNSYIIKSQERNLMIDTGMNRPECSEVMDAVLQELNVQLAKTDFFITHMHSDHCGLVGTLATATSRIYCSRPDAEVILEPAARGEELLAGARGYGFPEDELINVLARHPGFKYAPQGEIKIDYIEDGDDIAVGDYHFKCVATPGHTDGYMCLYEPDKKVLVSGDHVLDDITPNISLFISGNPLEDYLANLDKVYKMDIELTLPGHRSLIHDVKKRINELKHHHQERSAEILGILRQGSANAYQVASQMNWDIDCATWEEYPTPQKWFASGEAIAHLRYLEGLGHVNKAISDGINIYALS